MTREELREKVAFEFRSMAASETHNRVPCTWEQLADAAIAIVLEEAKEAVAYLRWQEVEPYDGRTLGAAVNAIGALQKHTEKEKT